jgi:thioredoxin reductase (NADPH)
MGEPWDCVIVGAGPAGLSAALYMARFKRRVLVVHDGSTRAPRIPKTFNAPGFPEGIAGPELVRRMTDHAREFGAEIQEAEVVSAERIDDDRFVLSTADGRTHEARALVLATGLVLHQLPLEDAAHEAAIRAGVLRYCPICDGYEHDGQRIGVIGCDDHGAAEALFVRQYSDDVTLVPRDFADLDDAQREALARAGIAVVERAARHYVPRDDGMEVHVDGRAEPLVFDVVYPAFGTRQRTELAVALGLPVDEAGAVDARAPYGTSVAGLYCAGDIVDGLDQISVAMGQGAIAATRAHNYLRQRDAQTLGSAVASGAGRRDAGGSPDTAGPR